jgi:hypothetical protein
MEIVVDRGEDGEEYVHVAKIAESTISAVVHDGHGHPSDGHPENDSF